MMSPEGKCLLVGGRARTGKDTFTLLLKELMSERGLTVASIAFALELKLELDPVLRAKYGISAFTTNDDEKKIIRPDLVAHGKKKREETNGAYWIDKVDPQVARMRRSYDVTVCTDGRYGNECRWAHSIGGKIIYIARIQPDGTEVDYANKEERDNDPAVRAAADIILTWPTVPVEQLRPYVERAMVQLDLVPSTIPLDIALN